MHYNKSCGYQLECGLFPHVSIIILTGYCCHYVQMPIVPLIISSQNLKMMLLNLL